MVFFKIGCDVRENVIAAHPCDFERYDEDAKMNIDVVYLKDQPMLLVSSEKHIRKN